ncbi:MAG TPA: ABC transporter permease subunit [Pseudomonadota bacterium]|nr:ABC transporter permease subunit [Rhodanobacteraceae bacterium]MBP9155322.1 ABC transporter permease subunit [Xanthomonadales bacterium]HQW80454.1 ABC transporter permease subunit [Pseudomonadota bacterium]
MTRWLVRIGEALLTLWLLVTLCFVLMRAAPGGPFDVERDVTAEIRARLEARYHLDEPLPTQYLRYLGQLARGDLGPSFQYPDYSVNELIAGGLKVSVPLGIAALLLALVIGVPLGLIAGTRAGRWPDHVASGLGLIGLALPKFVLAPLLVLCFAVWLGVLPAGGWDATDLRYAILPVLALAAPNLAYVVRLTRASLIDVLASDYILAARARGIEGRDLLIHHALRPTMAPIIAWIAPATIALVTGSVVVEQVFGIPGIGRYFVQGALNRDYTLVMGVALTAGVAIIFVNLAVDALRTMIDPRLRPD